MTKISLKNKNQAPQNRVFLKFILVKIIIKFAMIDVTSGNIIKKMCKNSLTKENIIKNFMIFLTNMNFKNTLIIYGWRKRNP